MKVLVDKSRKAVPQKNPVKVNIGNQEIRVNFCRWAICLFLVSTRRKFAENIHQSVDLPALPRSEKTPQNLPSSADGASGASLMELSHFSWPSMSATTLKSWAGRTSLTLNSPKVMGTCHGPVSRLRWVVVQVWEKSHDLTAETMSPSPINPNLAGDQTKEHNSCWTLGDITSQDGIWTTGLLVLFGNMDMIPLRKCTASDRLQI